MLPLGLLPLALSLLARGALTNGGVCMSGSGDGRESARPGDTFFAFCVCWSG